MCRIHLYLMCTKLYKIASKHGSSLGHFFFIFNRPCCLHNLPHAQHLCFFPRPALPLDISVLRERSLNNTAYGTIESHNNVASSKQEQNVCRFFGNKVLSANFHPFLFSFFLFFHWLKWKEKLQRIIYNRNKREISGLDHCHCSSLNQLETIVPFSRTIKLFSEQSNLEDH